MSEQNSNNTSVNLSELRDKIDNVDKQIQSLINERKLCDCRGKVKKGQ